ncbi:CHAT domain-containing protein [Novosphingobium sp. SL115]|uniref:CHAT domain-containing protein n=1 Tax=Novosphingobium sp. SL115 TaxID=2995150 RepID=UPI002275F19F|nr:CHAT domain-containing protein [Novosphingobium sp. SL115]MCY1669511.1 CHAT domain-containing protein [Novosphingobium sp. SL115]
MKGSLTWGVLMATLLVNPALSREARPQRHTASARQTNVQTESARDVAAASALARAFEYAQLASLSASTIALNTATILSGRQDTQVARLEEQRRAALQKLATVERAFEAALLTPDSAAPLAKLRANREDVLAEIAAIERAVVRADPAFAELVRPDAVTLKTVQALLDDDEVLLLLYTAPAGTYSFCVTRRRAGWVFASDLGQAAMTDAVGTMRNAIRRQIQQAGQANAPSAFHGSNRDLLADEGTQIHDGLIAPHAGMMAGKARVLAVIHGPLASLPLGLVSSGIGKDGTPRWFADQYLIGILPAVATLRSARCLGRNLPVRETACGVSSAKAGNILPAAKARTQTPSIGFLGVGDPSLGPPGDQRSRGDWDGLGGKTIHGDWLGRGMANSAMLASLPSLPGTRRELTAAAAAFGPAQSRLMLQREAQEQPVRSMLNTSGARFIAFATHGLLASQSGGLAEPGLVLSPLVDGLVPASGAEDGYLSASEIAQLRLRGAVVVLSACNTATSENMSAARNLNTLARAFEYAGARLVIATHWPVSDEATATLISAFFRNLAADRNQAPDIALQKAELELRRDPRWASPAFWAPFSVIGVAR